MLRLPFGLFLLLLTPPALSDDFADPQECSQVETDAVTRIGPLVEENLVIARDRPAGKLSSIHSPIVLRPGAAAIEADSVQGMIIVGAGASLGLGKSVNGRIVVCRDGRVEALETVNGELRLLPGVEAKGDLTTVNGAIRADGVQIHGALRSVGGDVDLRETRVARGIHFGPARKRLFGGGRRGVPRVVLGPGVTVEGVLLFEREVELFVHPSAVIGPVTGATAQPFTDTLPPRSK